MSIKRFDTTTDKCERETKVVIVKSTPIHLDVRIDIETEVLADAGYNIIVLGWNRDGSHSKFEKRDNYTIHRIGLKAPTGGNRISTVLYWPVWWYAEFLWLIRHEYDIIHAQNFDSIVPAFFAAKIRRKPLIFGIRDIYSYSVSSVPHGVRRIFLIIEKFFIKSTDAAMFANASQLELIGRNLNRNSIVICNAPKDIPKVNNKRTGKDFTLFFGGSFYKSQIVNLDKVIMAVKDMDSIRLIIAGYGDYVDELKELIKDINNVDFIGTIDYKEILKWTSSADLLFVLYDYSLPNNASCLPHKLFEAMAFGKPILVSDNTAMADFVRTYDCGIAVDCRNVAEIKKAIINLKDNPQYYKRLGVNGKKIFKKEFSWNIMKPRLLEFYNKILKNEIKC